MIGRFISADTIVPNPADPQSFNRYSYCLNNPLKYVDPTGHVVYIGGFNVKSLYAFWTLEQFSSVVSLSVRLDLPDAVYSALYSPEFEAYRNMRETNLIHARSLERSSRAYYVNLEEPLSDGNYQYMYITSHNSVERYEWRDQNIWFPFDSAKRVYEWERDFSYPGVEWREIDWRAVWQDMKAAAPVVLEALADVGQITTGILGAEVFGLLALAGIMSPITGQAAQFFWGLATIGLYELSDGEIDLDDFNGLYIPWSITP